MDAHQLLGAYIYSNSGQFPEESTIMNYKNPDVYGYDKNPNVPNVSAYGSLYNYFPANFL